MPKADSSFNMLVVAAVLALGIGYYVPQTFSQKPPDRSKAAEGQITTSAQAQTPSPVPAPKSAWAASAPGRVEPMGGEVRISGQAPGRITEVLAAVNDRVKGGDLLLKLADDELIARVLAARAEVAVRKRDRDNENVSKSAQDRRTAEDNFANAERQLSLARAEQDRAVRAQRSGTGTVSDLDKAREAAKAGIEKLDQTRSALQKTLANDTSIQTRLEAALTAARAELTLAEAALERTRIRAPSDGHILQVNAKVGEIVAPSPENILVVIGDISSLRVRAEFEERDIGKVRAGQAAVIRSDAFPGKDFEGRVSTLAQALGPSKLGQRGPRRPTDVDVLEVIIDLTGQPPLLPGMRVDVFLKAELAPQPAAAASQATPRTKPN